MENIGLSLLPSSLLLPGQWAFDAAFRVHDGYGHMSGGGDGIGDAVHAAFEDCCDGNLDEADPGDWNIRSLMYEGKSILHDTVGELHEARRELMSFAAWDDTQALQALVRRSQRAETDKIALDALTSDLCWILSVRNGGGMTMSREGGQRRWVIEPRLLHGTSEPCVPAFLLTQ